MNPLSVWVEGGLINLQTKLTSGIAFVFSARTQ